MTHRFTTADLENLAQGTTPGPWEWHDSDDPDMRHIYGEEGHMCIAVDSSGSDYPAADPLLAAAAPELAAELHRIRRALEAWAAAETAALIHLNMTNPIDLVHAAVAQSNVKNLNRILNGDNNE